MATAEFSKFAGILSAALSQHQIYMNIINRINPKNSHPKKKNFFNFVSIGDDD